MWRLAYRNFGTHQSLVTNQSVEASANVAGIRWWEIRSPNSSPVLYQEGTYSPADGLSRWMGSIAQDNAGNMALGYSVSDAATFPGVRYTGRLAGDPLGTMPQGEGTIVNGTGSQTGPQRWGDYTSMSVDPVDDCTFWYVNQWIPTTSPDGWRLRIGAFKFNECKINQTITFGANPGPVTYAPGGTFTVSATASSGLPVTFTSTTPGVCTVVGNTVTVVAVGNCIIAANQAGNANYNAAPQVLQTIAIISGLAGGASIPTLQEWALLLLGLLLGSLVWRQSRRIGRMEE
ncbi:MAG: IPTL-CTERM sorting domain-containing protein [Candidatus Contendobacter sp.]